MAEYAYVRVSTKEQRLDRQLAAMPETIPPENIFKEKESGKNFKGRPVWNALMQIMREGDTLYIKSLDRLGRNYSEMGIVWKDLMEKGVSICVLDMPILDTRNCNDLMMRVISDIVFTLFSYIAENERETICPCGSTMCGRRGWCGSTSLNKNEKSEPLFKGSTLFLK